MDVPLRISDHRGQQNAAERAVELAERQFGPISGCQLRNLGFSPARIRSWLASGRLYPRLPGVYALGRPSLGEPGELAEALLFAGSGAALSGTTALWWMGLLDRRPSSIHVDAPGRVASRGEIVVRHPLQLDRTFHRGLPVASLPRSLLVSSRDLRHDSLRLVLARADFQHILDLPAMHHALKRGRHGSVAVRAALGAHLPQLALCESPLEIDFVLLCERYDIELPEPNQRIRRWRPDMLWRDRHLIVELDGRDAHTSPAQIAADERRAADLRRRGFTVVRFTWEEVHFQPEFVISELRRLLA